MENIIPSFGAFESPKDKRDIKHTELVNAGLTYRHYRHEHKTD